MRQLNILHIVPSLEIGGMERVVCDLVRNLDRRRFNPMVACLHTCGILGEELIQHNVPVIQVPPMLPIVSFLLPLEIIRVIRRYSIDVVHVHSGCWHKAAAAAAFCDIKKVIYTEHGRWFPDKPVVMFLDRIYSRFTRYVVAVSADLASYMHNAVGIVAQKIQVIVNGIDLSDFRPTSNMNDHVTVGIVARLAPVKDIGTLIRAMAELRDAGQRVRLLIAGDGPERENLENLVRELRLTDFVNFLGYRRDIPEVFAGIDIFALSSVSEGTSITLLEAMASGKPVVVTRVGGNPAIIEDKTNGFLVPPGDPVKFAAAIGRLVADYELRKRMGEENRRKVQEQFSVEAMTAAYEKIYEEA